jgi:LacI family transcriptional regulator
VSLADLRSAHSIELVGGITEELAVPELEALISVAPQDGRRLDLFAHGLTDGLILIAPELTDDIVTMLKDSQQPVVIIDPIESDCPFPHVVADDYGGMRMLTGAVLAAGHSDMLYLQGEADSSARYRDRRNGFAEALTLAGPADAVIEIRGEDSSYEAGLVDASDYLAEHVPTAIVAASDAQAFAAVDAVRSRGLRVPEDVSVVGFGDVPQAAQSFPGLTTVHRPLHEMGRLAARTLVAQLDGVTPVQNRLELHTTYVERGSLGAVNRSVHRPKG